MSAPAPERRHHAEQRRFVRVSVPADLHDRISAAARRRNITLAGLVKVILSATFPDDGDGR